MQSTKTLLIKAKVIAALFLVLRSSWQHIRDKLEQTQTKLIVAEHSLRDMIEERDTWRSDHALQESDFNEVLTCFQQLHANTVSLERYNVQGQEIVQTKAQLASEREKTQSLEAELANVKDTARRLLSNWADRYASLQSIMVKSSTQVASVLKLVIFGMKWKLAAAETAKADLQKKASELERQLHDAKVDVEKHRRAFENNESRRKALEKDLKDKKKDWKTAEDNLFKLRQDLSKARKQLEEAESAIATATKTAANKEKELEDGSAKLDDAKSKLQLAENKFESLVSEKDDLQSRFAGVEESTCIKEGQLIELNEKIAAAALKAKKAQDKTAEMTKMVSDLQTKMGIAQADLRRSQEAAKAAEDAKKSVENSLEVMTVNYKAATEQDNDFAHNLKVAEAKSAHVIKKLESSEAARMSLEMKVETLNQEKDALQAQLDDVNGKLHNSQIAIESAEDRARSVRQELESVRTQSQEAAEASSTREANLRGELGETQRACTAARKANEALEARLEKASAELLEVKRRSGLLQGHPGKLTDDRDSMVSQLRVAQHEREEATIELRKTQEAADAASKKVEELESVVKDLVNNLAAARANLDGTQLGIAKSGLSKALETRVDALSSLLVEAADLLDADFRSRLIAYIDAKEAGVQSEAAASGLVIVSDPFTKFPKSSSARGASTRGRHDQAVCDYCRKWDLECDRSAKCGNCELHGIGHCSRPEKYFQRGWGFLPTRACLYADAGPKDVEDAPDRSPCQCWKCMPSKEHAAIKARAFAALFSAPTAKSGSPTVPSSFDFHGPLVIRLKASNLNDDDSQEDTPCAADTTLSEEDEISKSKTMSDISASTFTQVAGDGSFLSEDDRSSVVAESLSKSASSTAASSDPSTSPADTANMSNDVDSNTRLVQAMAVGSSYHSIPAVERKKDTTEGRGDSNKENNMDVRLVQAMGLGTPAQVSRTPARGTPASNVSRWADDAPAVNIPTRNHNYQAVTPAASSAGTPSRAPPDAPKGPKSSYDGSSSYRGNNGRSGRGRGHGRGNGRGGRWS